MPDLVVRVKATPGASKEIIEKIGEHQFEMFVREPAVNNMANRRMRVLVADAYKVPLQNVRLATGHRSRHKTFHVTM